MYQPSAYDKGLTRVLVEYGVRLKMTQSEIARELCISRQCVSLHMRLSEKIAGPIHSREFKDKTNKRIRHRRATRGW